MTLRARSLPRPPGDASGLADRPAARPWLLLVLAFLIGLFVARLPAALQLLDGGAAFERAISNARAAIRAHAVEPADDLTLQRGAISGMLDSLDDDYAEYIPAADRDDFEKDMTGEYVGIGAEVESRDGWLTIVSPLEDSPAMEAGLMGDDRVLSIDGRSTLGLSVDECIQMIKGPDGDPLTLVIQRNAREFPVAVTRRKIVYHAVRGVHRLTGTAANGGAGSNAQWNYLLDSARLIAYLRLSQFTPSAAEDVRAALESAAKAAGARSPDDLGAIILDMRSNPGGLLEAAAEVADVFLEEGEIVSVRGRAPGRSTTLNARKPETFGRVPLAVLIDQGSASASEIVAGALQDHGRAVVIGARSFGKGLVQTVIELPGSSGGQLKFTTQKYYLPSGRLIQREDDSPTWGVDPNPGFYVAQSERERFDWFKARRDLDVYRGVPDSRSGHGPRWSDPDSIRDDAKDLMLSVALTAVNARLSSGHWLPPSGEAPRIDQPRAIAADELRRLERARRALSRQFASIDQRIAALEESTQSERRQPLDLWPDSVDPTGGRVAVFDARGERLAELAITGPDLEWWLSNAEVEPAEGRGPGPDGAP